jgi:hypothetical protein
MPIPELTLLIFLFIVGIIALVTVSLLIASIVSGTFFLKRKEKEGKGEDLLDEESLQDVKR